MDITVSRNVLYGKLVGSLFHSLESATTFCKLRSNPYVELTHWLHQLIQQPENDIHSILRHYRIASADVEKALLRQLDLLPARQALSAIFPPYRSLYRKSLDVGKHLLW